MQQSKTVNPKNKKQKKQSKQNFLEPWNGTDSVEKEYFALTENSFNI